MRKYIYIIFLGIVLNLPRICLAMPPGTLVYRTSGDGRMFGYSDDPLIYYEKGIIKNINSGHVGIYIGRENGIDYVVEALSNGVVKTPANKFVNQAEGEKLIGAKIPKGINAIQQAKAVAIAKNLAKAGMKYDYDFKTQKGPGSGEWTCVGLTEKIYESANISNPNNLDALEYDQEYYALNITPDGYDNESVVNSSGDCFSTEHEFSKIAARTELLIPAPEIVGYDVGLVRDNERYIFLPATQFKQSSIEDVKTDIVLESSFDGAKVRGSAPTKLLVLRWSLINNPVSSLGIIAKTAMAAISNLKDKIFGTQPFSMMEEDSIKSQEEKVSASSTGKKIVKINSASKSAVKENEKSKSKTSASKLKSSSSQASSGAVSETKESSRNSNVTSKASSASINSNANAVYYGTASENVSTTDDLETIATINKIYSTGNNKWIELYNPGNQDFDLASAGYRLEKTKTAADPALIMRIGNAADGSYPGGTVIKAHGSYLIVKSTADSYYLQQADAVATRDNYTWPASGYTIYLGTGAISSNSDTDIVEALGFGSDASYFQGNAPASEIQENYSLNRIKNTGNNNLDFKLVKSSDPGIEWDAPISSEESSANTNVTGISVSTSTTNSNSNTNISSTTDNVASSTPNIDEDNSENIVPQPLVLNGLYGTGLNDWVEIYNPNNFDIDLFSQNYRLEKTKTAANPSLMIRIGDVLDGQYPKGTTIKAGDTYLIVRDDANEYFKTKANAIATRIDFNFVNSGQTIYLANGPVNSNIDENIVDVVGYGDDARYWKGQAAGPGMPNNYELKRVASSGNNNIDFELRKSDDPDIDWSQENSPNASSTDVYSFFASDYNLYVFPEPIESSSLLNLWHFDECGGKNAYSSFGDSVLSLQDNWFPGKFACAKTGGPLNGRTSGRLSELVDINNFTLSFWFRGIGSYPRLNLTMGNDDGDSLSMTLEQNLLEFTGLPNPDWRYYQPFAFDDTWRQATLVVDRDSGYWALYVDGQEQIRIASYQKTAPMDLLEISGNNGYFAIDELAILTRALSPGEVVKLRESEAPFNPTTERADQSIPELLAFWNFDEGIGSSSADIIYGKKMYLDKNAWDNYAPNNAAIKLAGEKKFSASIPELLPEDISISLKWKSTDPSVGDRAKISLNNHKTQDIFSFIPKQYNPAYFFNGIYSYYNYESAPSINLDDDWHYLALVYDSYRNQLNYYVDGERKGSSERIWLGNSQIIDSLELSGENGMLEIDDLGIWNGALSDKQIQSIFANN